MTSAPISAVPVKAFSLLEVLVAGALFAGLLTAVVLIELQARRWHGKEDQRSEAYRSVVILLEFIQSELDAAYVVPGRDGDDELTYRAGLRGTQGLALGPSGSAENGPETILRLNADGQVVRLRDTEVRPVTRLGREGRLNFRFPASNLLDITVHSRPQPGQASYDSQLQILLCNQN